MADKTIDDLTDLAAAPAGASFVPVWESGATKKVSVTNLLTNVAEVNDLTSVVTWANIPDANVPESAVTQHEAALSITQSQISDLSALSNPLAEDLILQPGDVYGYGLYTDASNYEGWSITSNGAGTVTLQALTLGAGTNDVDILLEPAGYGGFGIGRLFSSHEPDELLTVQGVTVPANAKLRRFDNTPTDDDVVGNLIFGWIGTGGDLDFASISSVQTEVTSSTEKGDLVFKTLDADNDGLAERMRITSGGMIQYGTHSSIGSETVTGYIEIKDASGTVRKVAIVS